MEQTPPVDRLLVRDARAWRGWLDEHEYSSTGVRLVLARNGVEAPTSLIYAEALDEALCSGWIDGRRNAADEHTFLQHFTPRRPASIWSQRNVALVATLVEAGRMRPRGLAEIERAQADGRWERAYAGQAEAKVPDDLAQAFAASPTATGHFDALSRTRRYAVIHQVTTAPSEASRANRIRKFLQDLEDDL